MISFLICSLVAYVLFGGVLFGCQRSLLYHPNQTIPDPAEFGLDGISVERIESDGGHRLRGSDGHAVLQEAGGGVVIEAAET